MLAFIQKCQMLWDKSSKFWELTVCTTFDFISTINYSLYVNSYVVFLWWYYYSVIELKSFLASLHLNAREFDPLALNWLHWAAWFGSFVISSLLTIIACVPLVTGNQEWLYTYQFGSIMNSVKNPNRKAKLHPISFLRICGFEEAWPNIILTVLHLILLLSSIALTAFAIR